MKAELDTVEEKDGEKTNSEMVSELIDDASMETVYDYGFQALIIISTFFPWVIVEVGSRSVTMIGATIDLSWILILFTGFSVVMTAIDSNSWTPRVKFGTSILMMLTMIYTWFHFNNVMRNSLTEGSSTAIFAVNTSIGVGFYLALLGTLGYLVISYKEYEAQK